jgi:hypothetical protein
MKKRGAIAYHDYEQEIKRLEITVYVLGGLVAISVAANICLIWWAQHSIVGG